MALVNAFGAIALDATLTGGTQKTKLIDGSGNVISATSNALDINIKSGTTVTVSGTIAATQSGAWTIAATQSGTWNITNISGTISLPTGASTAAKQPALGTAGAASADVITIQGIASMTALQVDASATTQPVSGTFWQATQPISAATLPLPSGASTSAKQPALGTAGSASADVISVQGIASMTPFIIGDGTNNISINTVGADALDNTANTLRVSARLLGYNGTTWDRLRTTGTGILETAISDGTQIANTIAGDSGQNSVLVAGSRKEVSFTTTTVQAVASTDVSNYKSVAVQVTSQGGSSTVTFQGSNDNSNWVSVGLISIASIGGTIAVTSTTSTGVYVGSIPCRYFRLNVTGIASGTTAGVIEFDAMPLASNVNSGFISAMSASTTGPMKAEDAAHASTDQGFAVWQVRKDTPVANAAVSADADYTPFLGDNMGKLWTAQAQTEDAAHASGDRGAFILGVRNDAAATFTSADGDYTPIGTDTAGRVGVTTLGSTTGLRIGDGTSSVTIATAGADASSNTVNLLETDAYMKSFNGSTHDRVRSGATAATSTLTGYINQLPFAKYNATPPTVTDGQSIVLQVNSAGALKVDSATLIAGEDLTYNRMMTMPKYTYSAIAVADVQIKSGPGILHSVTISCADATPTAGDIKIYDNTAESGTVVFHHNFSITPFMPFTVILDYNMLTGIYLGFTTTNDVNVSVSYL